MKATLKYDLSDREDLLAHMRAINSLDILLALSDVLDLVCKEVNECEEADERYYNRLDALRTKCFEAVSERDHNIMDMMD